MLNLGVVKLGRPEDSTELSMSDRSTTQSMARLWVQFISCRIIYTRVKAGLFSLSTRM